MRQKRKLDESGQYEIEDRRISRSGGWEDSPESEVLVNECLEPEMNWGKSDNLHFQNCDEGSERSATGATIDLEELSMSLEENKLQLIRVEDWILIQRSSFDVLIAEEPYHSIQIYFNLVTNKYVVRVWGISIKSGELLTTKDLQELCVYCFKKSAACVGYLGFPPGNRVELVRVSFPRTRWISSSCEVAYPKGQGSFTIGLCPACSGETLNKENEGRKENRVASDQTLESEERFESQENLLDDMNSLRDEKNGAREKQDEGVSEDEVGDIKNIPKFEMFRETKGYLPISFLDEDETYI